MRCTQFIGHTETVDVFLDNCTKVGCVEPVYGMFGEEVYKLCIYRDANGDLWREFVQDMPWSSGPMIFLAIQNQRTLEVRGWTFDKEGKQQYVDYKSGKYYV